MELLESGEIGQTSEILRRQVHVYEVEDHEQNHLNCAVGLIILLSFAIFSGILLCLIL